MSADKVTSLHVGKPAGFVNDPSDHLGPWVLPSQRKVGVICLIHVALMVVMGVGWWVLLPGTRLWIPVWGRFVRDAGSEVLPLAQIGGYLLGARAIMLAGVSGAAAAASTIVDVTLEFLAQIAFTALCLFWLIRLTPDLA